MKLESWHSSEDKRKYKIIRRDYIPDPIIDNPETYEILAADEQTGICRLQIGQDTKTLEFGLYGIRIIRRER